MIYRLSLSLPILRGINLIKFFIVIFKQSFFINKQNLILFRTERSPCGIYATIIRLISQRLRKHYLIIRQITHAAICNEYDPYSMTAAGDMHKHHSPHQILHLLQLIPYLHGIFHMVNVKHHETIQMAGLQQASAIPVKLIAAEDKRCQLLL